MNCAVEDQISLRSWEFTAKNNYQIQLLPYRNNVIFFRIVWNSYPIATHQVFIRIWISITSEMDLILNQGEKGLY